MISIDGLKFKEILAGGAMALEMNRSTIDELNVFPVPDGDTGTNMSLTISSAIKESNACGSLMVDEIAKAFSKGALKGARGNSGVISSQIFKGFAVALDGKAAITPKLFAECLKKGTEIAYSAVTKPKEGTILTVVRIMADTAVSVARGKKVQFEDFLKKVLDAGEEILKKTPEMLPVLKKAGVVDAGGRGLLTVFDGMYRTLVGEELTLISGKRSEQIVKSGEQQELPKSFDPLENDYEHITFQYCTEYFITHLKNEVTNAAIDKYRDYLMTLGDCVLVIGDTDLVKTHVHTNHPDRALKAALNLGELEDVKIENMLEQHRKLHANDEVEEVSLKEYSMISICCGDGMASIFKDLMVDIVVEGGQTMNPSVDEILIAINKANAKNVFVLPNNSNIILAANQAKELAKANVFVVPTTNMPQGISATLCFDEDSSPEDNFKNMCEAIHNVTCAEITHAVRSTRMNRYSVKEGDIIGICDKRLIAKSQCVEETALSTVRKIAQGKDMLSVYFGEDISQENADDLMKKVSLEFPELETACYFGGQPHYYYILSVE